MSQKQRKNFEQNLGVKPHKKTICAEPSIAIWGTSSFCLLKYVCEMPSRLKNSYLEIPCDTCDSKNTKTPVMCARTRTRESG